MPLPPLKDPSGVGSRILGQIKGWTAAILLFLAVLVCNVLQMASLAFWPFSRAIVRKLNREIANAWWTMCDLWSERLWNIEVEIVGDDIPSGENVLIVSNHQTMSDISTLFRFARSKGRLGDLKWFVKDALKYIPGIGWGMVFLDCVFLKRNWTRDRDSLERTFGKFKREQIPMWTITFAEGTRLLPHKLERSRAFAVERGLPQLNHLLLPRTKGFVAAVQGLREHLDAVYDATIAYENGVPSLWQWAKGYVQKAHLHVRRFPMDELPRDDAALNEWLYARFQEKDARLAHYYEHGVLR
ncbi:MAG TPA: acyltransferase [Myxococcales bacterium]|nr:acyltransferase [Myxococcales bacterium]HIN85125.1 acyltransferase [Myxococcales bacterium]